MSAQHSSLTSKWGTPECILELVREVLGSIDLDPCSSEEYNTTVRANSIITEEQNALAMDSWSEEPVSIFINPPSGKYRKRSMPIQFWNKLMSQPITHAIYLGFSIEQLPQGQDCELSFTDFATLLMRKRIKFKSNTTEKDSPTHSNFITYVPGTIDLTDKFIEVFQHLGQFITTLRCN